MRYSRPRSSCSDYSRSSSKPKMQTQWKQRNNSGILNTSSKFIPQTPKSAASSKKKSRSKSVIIEPSSDENVFHLTSSRIQECNFKHHDPNVCVCDQCTCGRHLCKLHTVKPNLPKESIYHRDFKPKSSVPNIVNIAKQYQPLKGPNLNLDSTFFSDFPQKQGDPLERPKPEDLLKTGGPGPQLSSYRAEFPGHKGKNQYVKPTDKHTRGNYPLRGRSTYKDSYKGKPPKDDDWQGLINNLKTGTGWFGGSTYGNSFKSPNPQHYPAHVKVKEKLQINPNYKNQYQTSYRNDFVNKGRGVCPAKIALQTKQKGFFKNSKDNFEENTDFKALSPDFKAISTSKFTYV